MGTCSETAVLWSRPAGERSQPRPSLQWGGSCRWVCLPQWLFSLNFSLRKGKEHANPRLQRLCREGHTATRLGAAKALGSPPSRAVQSDVLRKGMEHEHPKP
jgi:hypothetical protein